MKGKRLATVVGMLCLALAIAALPFIGACAPEEAPPETPTPGPPTPPAEKGPLKYGMSICMTGVAAEKGSPMGHGKLDCIKYVNEELGGINGYPVEAIWYDNAYDAAKAATIVKKLMDDGALFFTTNSSKMMSASMEIANREGFPGIASFSSPACTNPPKHMYAQMPDYGDDWAAFANYYMTDIWKGTGKPKMALHLLNNSTGYGARDAALALADELGIELLPEEEHTAVTSSETESMLRIKAMNPDVLFISSTPAPTAVVLKAAYELGMYPGIVIGCAHASYTKALIDITTSISSVDAVEGVYGVFPTVNWGDDVPGMAKMTEYCKKLHPKDYGNMDYITSWAEALIGCEILRLAVENCGYDTLAKGDATAWECVETNGIQKLSYDVAGLHGPASYTPGDNRLDKSVRVFAVENGVITPVTGWVDAPRIPYEKFPEKFPWAVAE
jgi:branched-chain amino acid transport system substrate-binding protein